MKRRLAGPALAILCAVLAYELGLSLLPRLIMNATMHGIVRRAGDWNSIYHAPRASASDRRMVMPSPDMLYSACPYDLKAGPLQVLAQVPLGVYWSLSAYDDENGNYYAVNDLQATGRVAFVVLPEASPAQAFEASGARVLHSPSRRGVVLLRTLSDPRESGAETLEVLRRESSCRTLPAQSAGSNDTGRYNAAPSGVLRRA